jgi:hypothetical protein
MLFFNHSLNYNTIFISGKIWHGKEVRKKMRNTKIRLKEIFSLNSIQYLSNHEISDIIGNYSRNDFCIDKKKYSDYHLNFFAQLLIEV